MQSGSFVVLLALALLWTTAASAVEVVVNAAQPKNEVSRSLARGIFGMRVRAWPDGVPVRVFVLEDSRPLHQEFCKSVLQMYPYQLRQNWDRLLYSGTGQQPVIVATEDEMMRRVAETPGSIGYVNNLPAPETPAKTKTKTKPAPLPTPAANVKVLHVY